MTAIPLCASTIFTSEVAIGPAGGLGYIRARAVLDACAYPVPIPRVYTYCRGPIVLTDMIHLSATMQTI